jgi:hypothetical protein
MVTKSMVTKPVKKKRGRNTSIEPIRKVKPKVQKNEAILCPESSGCARASISGWEWRNWARNATPLERARVRGYRVRNILLASDKNVWTSQAKAPSARTNRVKLRNLLAAAEGSDLLKITQMKVLDFRHLCMFWFYEVLVIPDLCLFCCVGKEKAVTFSEEQNS